MLTAVHLEFTCWYHNFVYTAWIRDFFRWFKFYALSDWGTLVCTTWKVWKQTAGCLHLDLSGSIAAGKGSISGLGSVFRVFSWFTHLCGRHVDQHIYALILADHVHRYIWIDFPPDDGAYQLENMMCHKSRSVRAGIEEDQVEFFIILFWLPNSSYLNPVKNMWNHLSSVVHTMDHDPRNTTHWIPHNSTSQ